MIGYYIVVRDTTSIALYCTILHNIENSIFLIESRNRMKTTTENPTLKWALLKLRRRIVPKESE